MVLKALLKTIQVLDVMPRSPCICYMGADIEDTEKELSECGMQPQKDFAFVDAGGHALNLSMFSKGTQVDLELKVDWLKGRYVRDQGVFVWYEGR